MADPVENESQLVQAPKLSGAKGGLHIERVPLTDLHADPANARSHGDRNLDAIGDSLRSFGQVEPLVVQRGTGRVIGGNGRLAVMRREGQTHADVVYLDIDDHAATRLGIALNRTAELAEWNKETLASLLDGMGEADLLTTGFDADSLKDLLADLTPPEVVEDEAPAPLPDPVSKTGDLWEMGGHRLLCGDSTKGEDVLRVMGGEKAPLLFTSPPYSDQRTYTGVANLSPEHLSGFISAARPHVGCMAVNLGVARKGGFVDCYWDAYINKAQGVGLGLLSWNIWYRTGGFSVGQITAMFPIEHEFVFVLGEKPVKLCQTVPNTNGGAAVVSTNRDAEGAMGRAKSMEIRECLELGTVLVSPPVNKNEHHPAQFPVALPSEYIKAFGGNVYEPFSGSGTTIIAAEQLGRKCYAIEIEPRYVDVAVRRWEKLTGKQATCNGQTFAQVAESRGVAIV